MIKTKTQQMDLTKSVCKLIQFNRELIKDNIYTTQANSTINTKLIYFTEK